MRVYWSVLRSLYNQKFQQPLTSGRIGFATTSVNFSAVAVVHRLEVPRGKPCITQVPRFAIPRSLEEYVLEIETVLKRDGSIAAFQLSRDVLIQANVAHIDRHHLYESLLKLFARNSDWRIVDVLWREMKMEGFIPSTHVRTVLLPGVFRNPHEGTSSLPLPKHFKEELFSQIHVGEGFFCSLLANASRSGTHPSVLEKLLEQYTDARGTGRIPGYAVARTMMAAYTRAKDAEGLQRWVEKGESLIEARASVNSARALGCAVTTTLHSTEDIFRLHRCGDVAMRKTLIDPSQMPLLAEYIDRTRELKLLPDLVAYNVLISACVRLYDFKQVERRYGELYSALPRCIPDNRTYGSMFKAHEVFRSTASSRVQSLAGRIDFNPRPRTLFQQLLYSSSLRRRQENGTITNSLLTQSLLRVIVRSFVIIQDYAAALMAVEAFRFQGIQMENITRQMIWKILVKQVVKKMRKNRSIVNPSIRFRQFNQTSQSSWRRSMLPPTRLEIESAWAGKMLDDSVHWERNYTVGIDPADEKFESSCAIVLQNSILNERVYERLRYIAFRDLQQDEWSPFSSMPLDTLSSLPHHYGGLNSSSESKIDETLLLKSILRRAIIMTRLSLHHKLPEGEEVFQREMRSARKAMIPRPSLLA